MHQRRPHEPRELRLLVSRGEDGGLVIRTPMTPGWAFCARSPAQLAEGIERAYAECAVAAYARLRGVLYDLAETEEEIPAEAFAAGSRHPSEPEAEPEDEVAVKRRKKHPLSHPPEAWTELEDGGMLSPGGLRYGPDTQKVQQVRALVASRAQRSS